MLESILDKIWELSPDVNQPEAYRKLQRLTNELSELYQKQGRLAGDPFSETRERKLHMPVEKIKEKLNGTTCLVTGGLGCVGSKLVQELLNYDIQKIIILDNSPTPFTNTNIITRFDCDIRDVALVNELFATHRPHYVFHTAAQRDPGRAEANVVEAVTTNVLGTMVIVKACERCGSVRQLVSASTGKSSRYFTEEVYAATKKMGEFIIDTFATYSQINYSLVRFTHILDNSLMDRELKKSSSMDSYLNVHSPGKYVTAQSVGEAVGLMVNALLYSQEKQCRLLLVKELSWPVESLALALYYREQAQRDIPVVFCGNPVGYCEKYFRGQTDWSKPDELNLLINVYEQSIKQINPHGDIIISRPCPTSLQVLHKVLSNLENVRGEGATREALIDGLKELVQASLLTVERTKTMDILRWGLDPRFLKPDANPSDFNPIVEVLTASLEGTLYYQEVKELRYQPAGR